MSLIEHTPLFWWQFHRVLETLKDRVPVLGAVPVPSKGRERKCVCSVVRKVKATIKTETLGLRVLEAASPERISPSISDCAAASAFN